jgi:hypothetical protein
VSPGHESILSNGKRVSVRQVCDTLLQALINILLFNPVPPFSTLFFHIYFAFVHQEESRFDLSFVMKVEN